MFELERHPPERGRASMVEPCACSSCCCCCCLHTVGGLIGASVVSGSSPGRAKSIYWVLVILGSLLAVGGMGGAGGFILLLAMPAVQLAAGLIGCLVVALTRGEDRGAELRQMGRLVLYTVLGTVLGVAAMVLIVGLLVLVL